MLQQNKNSFESSEDLVVDSIKTGLVKINDNNGDGSNLSDFATAEDLLDQIFVPDLYDKNTEGDLPPYKFVKVVEAFSPSFFWIQLGSEQRRFQSMMNIMETFYNKFGENYKIPQDHIKKDLQVASRYLDKWHRAIITKIKPDNTVKLFFYDFGTVQTYPVDELRFLHLNFTNLKAQAVACALYLISPWEGVEWSQKECEEFVKIVSGRSLWASIASIDIQNNLLLIDLTDTSTSEDYYISSCLIQRKIARTGTQRPRYRNFLYEHYLNCKAFELQENLKFDLTNLNEKKSPLKSVGLPTETDEKLNFLNETAFKLNKLKDDLENESDNGNTEIIENNNQSDTSTVADPLEEMNFDQVIIVSEPTETSLKGFLVDNNDDDVHNDDCDGADVKSNNSINNHNELNPTDFNWNDMRNFVLKNKSKTEVISDTIYQKKVSMK